MDTQHRAVGAPGGVYDRRVDTFLFVVFDIFSIDLDVDHLTRIDLQQQLLLLLLDAVDVFNLARLASLLFLSLNQLLSHLRLHHVTSHAVAMATATPSLPAKRLVSLRSVRSD